MQAPGATEGRGMKRLQFGIVTAVSGLAALTMVASVTLATMNRSLQQEIGQRQQYVQQSVQLEGLYREIVRALAELGARNNDQDVRALLRRHGITYSANAPAPANPPAQAPRK
jgi:hypothetical protein